MQIVRIKIEAFVYGIGDPLAHLRCRGLREGDDKQLVDVKGMLALRDQLHNALDENSGFAAACRRRYEDVVISRIDYFTLLVSEMNCHAFSSGPQEYYRFPFLFFVEYPGTRGSKPQTSL